MMTALWGWVFSQLPGIIFGLVIAWHIPVPPFFATFWAWLWKTVSSAVTSTPKPPTP